MKSDVMTNPERKQAFMAAMAHELEHRPMLQIFFSRSMSKHGFSPADIEAFIQTLRKAAGKE